MNKYQVNTDNCGFFFGCVCVFSVQKLCIQWMDTVDFFLFLSVRFLIVSLPCDGNGHNSLSNWAVERAKE